jgi:nanoRNase/pAp phosphatase (c-di-AMP/oligoRNAs hydrolase)
MTARLVLGCGSLGYTVVESLADRKGDLLVRSLDELRVGGLRDEGVAAELGDPADAAALEDVGQPATVLVATDDAERNRDIAQVAAEAFPEALLVVYAGAGDIDAGVRTDIETIANRVVDPTAAVADAVLERAGGAGIRVQKLASAVRRIEDGPLAVVAHDNPDPDAIASAVALQRIAEARGTPAEACYSGEITHQENRALVNLLDLDLTDLGPEADLSRFGGVALVDHSRPGVNNQLPEDTKIDIVIDHHPPREAVDAGFVDLRPGLGSTSTMLAGYYDAFGQTPETDVATGLLYGIRVDTREFTREATAADFEAAAGLLPHADASTLERVETPSMSAETLDTIGNAITNREVRGSALASCVGMVADRDALAQAADRLLNLEDVATTLVYGYRDGTIYASARARGTGLDIGETLRDAFGQIGSAGGHADMAGAQLSLGLLGEVDQDSESLAAVVEDTISELFFEAVAERPAMVIPGGYAIPELGEPDAWRTEE